MNKSIGTILSLSILIIVFAINGFFHINLSINGLPFYINFILILLILILYKYVKYFHNKFIPFIISSFIMQNLLISGLDNLIYSFGNTDAFNDFSFVIIIPASIIGMIIWGIIFDIFRSKKNKHCN